MKFPPPFYRWRPHPWHGLETGPNPPSLVHAYIEITPFDLMKYEIDKTTGYLRVDRPQRSSSMPPALYGFIPRTYCDARVAKLSINAERGDGDPLDICVLSERPINRAEVIVECAHRRRAGCDGPRRGGRQDHCGAAKRLRMGRSRRYLRSAGCARRAVAALLRHV